MLTLEINIALWGMIVCSRFGKWRVFRGLLAKKPSNDRDGDPADTNYPSEHGDASQGKPCGRP